MKKDKYIKLSILGILILAVMCCAFLYLRQGKKTKSDNDKAAVNQNETLEPEKVTPEETLAITEALQEYTSITESTQEETIQEETTQEAVSQNEEVTTKESGSNNSVSLAVNVIYQYPDMPSGCEVTALTMVLNYMGINVTNKYLADNYLDASTYDMFESFVGSVYDDSSFGCFAPVIVKTADAFFDDNNYEYKAVNISGSTKEQLIDYLHDNKPVIIWNTEDMRPTYLKEYNLDGYQFTWHGNEHCVVLCGYNEKNNTFEIADSIAGKVIRDADIFFQRYEEMLSQAVIINNK